MVYQRAGPAPEIDSQPASPFVRFSRFSPTPRILAAPAVWTIASPGRGETMNPNRSAPSIPIIDLGGEYRSLKSKMDAAVTRVLSSGSYILGEETRRLEEEIA